MPVHFMAPGLATRSAPGVKAVGIRPTIDRKVVRFGIWCPISLDMGRRRPSAHPDRAEPSLMITLARIEAMMPRISAHVCTSRPQTLRTNPDWPDTRAEDSDRRGSPLDQSRHAAYVPSEVNWESRRPGPQALERHESGFLPIKPMRVQIPLSRIIAEIDDPGGWRSRRSGKDARHGKSEVFSPNRDLSTAASHKTRPIRNPRFSPELLERKLYPSSFSATSPAAEILVVATVASVDHPPTFPPYDPTIPRGPGHPSPSPSPVPGGPGEPDHHA